MGSSDVEPFTAEIYRRPEVYLFGTQQTPVLEFTITFACEHVLDASRQAAVSRWLFGHQTYKKLQIVQCDYQDVYFNCLLMSPEIGTYGNYPYSITCTVLCDSPFAWEEPRTYKYGPVVTEATIIHENMQDDNYYTFPVVEFQLTGNSTDVTFTNITDNNSYMKFTNLLAGETITVDCKRGIITGNSGLLRADNFDGIFFRLLPNLNEIKISGMINYLKIIYKNARKVGA